MKTVLVTGGNGFIGRHLARSLKEKGYAVIVVDNLSTSPLPALADSPRAGASGERSLPWRTIVADIVQSVPDVPCDQIYHLACPASPKQYSSMPVETIRACVDGTYNVIQHAEKWGARMVMASTSEVYGSQETPMREDSWGLVNPYGPRACYDEGKRCAEALAWSMSSRNPDLDIRIARIFNVYGPGMALDDGRMIPNFMCQAFAGKSLTIYGDGTQTRSLVYVDDMAKGLVRLMESGRSGSKGLVCNLGNDQELSVNEIARKVVDACTAAGGLPRLRGAPVSVHAPLPDDDPPWRKPELDVARKMLQWSAETPLADGLAATARDFGERLGLL